MRMLYSFKGTVQQLIWELEWLATWGAEARHADIKQQQREERDLRVSAYEALLQDELSNYGIATM